MPWCEYLIKCYAWNRMETEKWKQARMIAFNARVGSHLDPKHLPKNEESFLPLQETHRKKASKESLERLRQEREMFLKQKKN